MRYVKVGAGVYSYEIPNFYGNFYDLSPAKSKELEAISMKGKLSIVSENIIKNKGLVNYRQIGLKIDRSVAWVRQKVYELKIKEAETYKRTKYFDSSIITKLENLRG